jgi:hypothetical protein
MVNGTANFAWTAVGVGVHSLTARYSGDANYPATTSTPPVAVNVAPDFTLSIAGASSSQTVIPGQAAVFSL